MSTGRHNIITGCIMIFLAGIGGFCLGFSMTDYFPNGFYAVPFGRALLKAGHTHGMPYALYNLIVGGLMSTLILSEKSKKILSICAICTVFMPIGLMLRGLTDGAYTYAPIVMIGAIAFFIANGLMLKGAISK